MRYAIKSLVIAPRIHAEFLPLANRLQLQLEWYNKPRTEARIRRTAYHATRAAGRTPSSVRYAESSSATLS
jgi:hypothetical protein